MIPLTLDEVAAAVDGQAVDGSRTVRALTTDSRDVPPEALFVALRGEHHDGHDYIGQALDAGAVGFVTDGARADEPGAIRVGDTLEALGRLGAAVRDRVAPLVVAITGSVGKTTTKDLIAAALGSGRRTVAAEGSYNNEIGVPLTLTALEADTEAAVIEIGARGRGHIAALLPLVRPDIAVVTSVAGVHLELFGTIDDVAAAKGELVEGLGPGGTAVLNGDDGRVAGMADRAPGRVLTYGVEGGTADSPDLLATDVRLDGLARPSFRARTPWCTTEVTLPLAGAHYVGNALAALAVAGVAGLDVEKAAAALADAHTSSWRGEATRAGGIVVLNDAYNASPYATRAALRTLVAVERSGETWAVLGVMAEIGPDHEPEHVDVGAAVAALDVDHLIVVGDGAAGIAGGARDAGMDADRVTFVPDAEAALRALGPAVGPGDVVLVKASRVAGLEHVAKGLVALLDDEEAER